MSVRTFLKIAICLCLVILMIFGIGDRLYSQVSRATAFAGDFKPFLVKHRIVIKLATRIDAAKLRRVNGAVITGIQSLDALNSRFQVSQMTSLFPGAENLPEAEQRGLARVYRIEFAPLPDVTEIVTAFSSDPNIEYAQPIGVHKVYGTIPNDPYFSNQWGLTRVQAPDAWDISQGDSSVILAILDTGVDWLHPDLGGTSPYLQGNIWTNWIEYGGKAGVDDDQNGYVDDFRGWDWVDVASSSYPAYPGEDGTLPDNNPMDFNGHGTHCAGIASAITNNSIGVAGLAWGCKIMPLRAGWSADYMGYEVGLVDMSFCAQGIYYAASKGASAVNCSWGSSNTGGIADAIDFATSQGVIIVSAAGNDDLSDASYLCSRHDVIAVAATDPNDNKTSYSSFGFWVDVAAPGGDYPPTTSEIYSTYYDHNTSAHTYEWLSGTSMAAPHVVGLISLISSQFPGLSWQDKKDRLQFTSANIDLLNPNYKAGLLGEGRINAFAAVSQIDLPSMTTLFTENFDSGLPTTWTADPFWRDDDPGDKNLTLDDTYDPGTIAMGYDIWTPPFMIVDSDYEGYVNIDASLISPIIDCSMYSNIRLVFNNWFQNYGAGNIEHGDIDVRIDQGAWQTVASFVDNIGYNIVDAGRAIVVRLPSSLDYQSNVQFRWHYYDANYDLFWGIDNVQVMGQRIDRDYYVNLTPSSSILRGEAGDTLAYRMKIKNIGLLSDSYDLSALDFSWQTTIWDSAESSQITNTGVLATREDFHFVVKVAIPGDAALGNVDRGYIQATSTTDTSVYARATLLSIVTTIGKIPWFEDFPTMVIDTLKWDYNTGPAQISEVGIGEPSPPYALNLNGDALGGDEIQSSDIDLSADSSVILSYFYQRTGGGNSTETGEDLLVDYLNASHTWINLKKYPGDGPDMSQFSHETVPLPADAYHRNFRIRFHNTATAGFYDDWFIDDVFIAQAPDIDVTYTPDPFDFTLDLGDSTTAAIAIRNDGGSDLFFSIADQPIDTTLSPTFKLLQGNFDFQAVLEANFQHSQTIPQIQAGSHGIKNASNQSENNLLNAVNYRLEQMLESYQNIAPATMIKAAVLDGWGTYSTQAIATWNYLNLNYNNFGSQPIIIDYTSLDKDNITHQDLVNSAADVLIISDNWGYYSSGSQNFYLSPEECQAVAQYINEGHGLYISAGTFNNLSNPETQPQVDYLAELVGLSANASYAWSGGSYASPVNLVDISHPVFKNMPNPYSPGFPYSCVPISGNWNDALATGTALGISSDNQTAIIANQNRIYFSALPEAGSPGVSDYQFLYNVIAFAGISEVAKSWLTFNPVSGSVAKDSSVAVQVSVSAADLLPDTKYYRAIDISSNDPDVVENPFQIEASLTVKPTDFYFIIAPTSQNARGKAGDTLAYQLNIKNYGQLSDSYDLTVANNNWKTTFWDSTGTIPITNTGSVASKAEVNFTAKVEIPINTKYGDADTAKIYARSVGKPALARPSAIQTASVGLPASIPWSDDFKSKTLDQNKWIFNSGPAEANELALKEPSPPYSLNLDGYATGGDEVRSGLIDLSKDSLVMLSYYWQRGGSGDPPDYGDNLRVEYSNSAGGWNRLMEHLGEDSFDSAFSLQEIVLPAKAYHNAFQVKFHSLGNNSSYSNDDWFVDNVSISRPPVIQTEPEKYDVTVIAGDSVTGEPPLTIYNSGEGTLRYRVLSMPSGGPQSVLEFEPATRAYPVEYYSMELGKEQIDPRKGAPVILDAGGPDQFGYYWIDSDESGGPAFAWVDIAKVGTEITGLSGDSNVGFFPIGFDFPFYGKRYSMFRFCVNGFISFTSSSTDWSNDPIPNQSVFNLIAPFWDDLYYDYTSSKAYYHFDGERLIIQYNNFVSYSQYNTFEVLLYRDGSIVFQYLYMPTSSASATIGIQNYNGSDGLEIAFNTPYTHDRLAIYISTGVPWIQLDHTSGSLATDQTDTIAVKFNAKAIAVDTVLYANIVVRSNDPLDSSQVITTRMEVKTAEYIKGMVQGAGNPLASAVVQVWDEYPIGSIIDEDITKSDGKYFLAVPPVGGIYTVRAYARGYLPAFKEGVPGNTANLNFSLKAVPTITPTTEWVDFFSKSSKFWGGLVQIGDVITAEDPDSVICGIYMVDKFPGYYGFMPVYRDDSYSVNIDEGAQPGDTLTFRINGYLAKSLGPDSPVWTSHGSIRNVDLRVEEIDTVKIPLIAGWNLVSWYVKTAEDSTRAILKEILSQAVVVLGYENGGLVYDPKNPDLSNLKKMDHLHGYWIKMADSDTLLVIGNPADYLATPIYSEPGWNLVSYLPKDADSVAHALNTVIENLVRAYGFKNGAKTYDPNMPEFSTLPILCPGSGYWLYLTNNDTLLYPEPIDGIHCPDESPGSMDLLAFTGESWRRLIPTTEWINIFGDGIKLEGELLPIGTRVYATDPEGITCGEFVVVVPGRLGFMPIYRDDPQTARDEGAKPGDPISIYINNFEIPVNITWTSFGDIIDLGAMITSVIGELRNLPTEFDLSHNYPNPFNPQTIIKFQLPRAEYVTLTIYNMLGQVVKSLVAEDKPAGFYDVIWDGRDNRGVPVANGIYLYQLKAGKFEKTRKMIMLK